MRHLLSLCFAAPLACAHGDGGATPGGPPPGPTPRERLVMVEGTAGRLRVSDGGAGGPPVVLVHGLGSDLEVWRAELEHLRAAGRRAVAYDQRGHGGSEKARDGVYTVLALAEDLEAVRRALGLGRIVLVGHSLSGTVLTTYAGAHPEVVAGLVYVDAVGQANMFPKDEVATLVAQETAPSFGRAEQRAVFAEMLEGARPSTREAVLGSLARIDPPAFGLLRQGAFTFLDARARLALYRGPATAIEVGAEPRPFAAAAALGLPRTAVGDASHWVQLDQPEAVSRAIDAFLATLPDVP
jgi:pimeloyl-ACP methyl ester carboxylesterase